MTTAEAEESLMLSMLNDDCIFKILEWLPLEELCLCSRACKRLQILCNNHFQRKYHKEISETVDIGILSSGDVHVLNYGNTNRKYIAKYFNNFIKRLQICFVYHISKWSEQKVLSFVKSKCDPSMHEIAIQGLTRRGNRSRRVSASALLNMEVVNLIRRIQYGRHVTGFSECFSNLTALSLTKLQSDDMTDAFLGPKYPRLKHFHLEFSSKKTLNQIKAKKLKKFLQINSQIQCIVLSENNWHYHNNNGESAIVKMQCIKTLTDHSTNLEYLFIDIDEALIKLFERTCRHLEKLCNRSIFKSLELKFNDNRCDTLMAHTNPLANLRQLKKIHIRSISDMTVDLNKTFSPFVHLKSIAIDYRYTPALDGISNGQWSTVEGLSSLVDKIPFIPPPQIEEVILRVLYDVDSKSMWTHLMLFARHWANLRKLSVFKMTGEKYETFPVAELSQAREKLANAQELTIYTDDYQNETNLHHKLVSMQCVAPVYYRKFHEASQYCMCSTEYYHCGPSGSIH